MVNEKVEPALTPAEWAEWERERCLTRPPINSLEYRIENAGRLDAAMALANHALPDGHPLKITRAHVQALRDIESGCQVEEGASEEAYTLANQAIAILAALLPPDA